MDFFDFDDIIEIKFPAENFLKIKETLTRIGEKLQGKNLKQLAYILHKQGRYYILHYKQLQILDGEDVKVTDEEIIKTDLIISVLKNWGLIDIANPEDEGFLTSPNEGLNKEIKIVPFKEKYKWNFTSPYKIGYTG